MKTSNRWLSLFGVAIIMAASGVIAYSDFSDDVGCFTEYLADGDCDESNNNAECGFDSGDCCACTCESTESYTCGGNGYACVDPDAACVDDDDITIDVFEHCEYPPGIGNGHCNIGNNKEECDYDGGDCCECTCVGDDDPGDDDFGRCGPHSGFACVDPSAPCVDDDSVTVDMIDECQAGQIGDGWCDDNNNKEECAFDGGDCCDAPARRGSTAISAAGFLRASTQRQRA
ncbi:unnamed protein product [Scytosiphon promiscuus]